MDEYVQAVRELGRAARDQADAVDKLRYGLMDYSQAIDHGISAIDQAQSAISDAISMIERAMDDCRRARKPESTHRFRPGNGSK